MKKLLLLLSLFVCITAIAQGPPTPPYTKMAQSYNWTQPGFFSAGLGIPVICGTPAMFPKQVPMSGALVYDSCYNAGQGRLYYYQTGAWKAVLDSTRIAQLIAAAGGGGSTDLTGVRDTLNLHEDTLAAHNARIVDLDGRKVDKADSIPGGYYPYSTNPKGYYRPTDTVGTLATQYDLTQISGGINKVYSDTGLVNTNDSTLKASLVRSNELDSVVNRSTVVGWGHSFVEQSPGYISKFGELSGRSMINRGVSGQTASGLLSYFNSFTSLQGYPAIIDIGINDILANLSTARSNILSNVASIVARLQSKNVNNYVVLSITNQSPNGTGTAQHDTIVAINATLATIYGSHYANTRQALINAYNPAIPADVADNANDEIPWSLRRDSLHLNAAGDYVVADYLFTQKGSVLFDTSYKSKLIDANKFTDYITGQSYKIGTKDSGVVYIGSTPIAYAPNSTYGNIFFGSGGRSLTYGATQNTSSGHNALLSLTSGNYNTAFGNNSMRSTTTGSSSTAIGRYSLYNNTSGGSNNAFGAGALQGNTSGSNNVGIGSNAITGANASNNVGIGGNVMFNTTSASNNTAVGTSAMVNNSTGGANAAFAYEALRNTNTGTFNVGVGQSAGSFNTTGSNNTAVGYQSMWGSDGSGAISGNTALGRYSMRAITAGADNNIAIGNASMENSFSGDGNIIIGNSVDPQSSSGSNQLSIGNLIFGEGGFGTGTTVGTGRVGIKEASIPASASFSVGSTSGGVLLPRLTTTQQNAISSPATGLMIINTDSSTLTVYNGTAWRKIVLGEQAGGSSTASTIFNTPNGHVTANTVVKALGTLDVKAMGDTTDSDNQAYAGWDASDNSFRYGSLSEGKGVETKSKDSTLTVTDTKVIPTGTLYGSDYILTDPLSHAHVAHVARQINDSLNANTKAILMDKVYDSLGLFRGDTSFILKSLRVRINSAINPTKTITDTTIDISLDATTIGANYFKLTNPSAVTFPRQNADNTITSRSASELKTDLALNNVDNTSDATKNSATATLTNKRWTPRVGSTTSSATPTINTDNVDIYKLTAQTADITSFTTNLSGTPVDGDILEIQITGTAARAITWGASFVSSTVTLPTTTVTTATLSVVFQYFTTSSYGNNKWICVNSF